MVRVVRLERTVSWSQTRRDTNFAIPGYSIAAIISRREGKSKIFLSVVIPVVKAAFVPFSAIEENPANAGVARLCGVSPYPVPDTATALPKQARYQLRYTRLFSLFIRLVVFSQTRRDTSFAIPGCAVHPVKNTDRCVAGNGNAHILSDFRPACKSKMVNSAVRPASAAETAGISPAPAGRHCRRD